MLQLAKLLQDNQSFLIKRVLEYAKQLGYVKYTSTLEEAWIASISGLTGALTTAMIRNPSIPEISVDHDFFNDPVAQFGIIEAQQHRRRGISMEMYLSLMKYYRQSYLDLVTETVSDAGQKNIYLLWILRFFDFTEIAFCAEWNAMSNDAKLTELQQTNRNLTNEKNRFLTIFESMPTPALILDENHCCTNMNHAAQVLLHKDKRAPGYMYYSDATGDLLVGDILPWLYEAYNEFINENAVEKDLEADFESYSMGERNLLVKFHKMMDVSEKFEGTVIILNDMTESKKIQEQLRSMGIRDQLTGLYNRTYMEEELNRLSAGRHNPVAFISIDVDGLKLVNDNYGHSVGDALLVTVSALIKHCFRENDAIIRIGGDEFFIIIPSCNADTAQKSCEKLRSAVNAYNQGKTDFPISISIGWASGDLHVKSNVEKSIREADNRMYAEKKMNHARYETIFWQRFSQAEKPE